MTQEQADKLAQGAVINRKLWKGADVGVTEQIVSRVFPPLPEGDGFYEAFDEMYDQLGLDEDMLRGADLREDCPRMKGRIEESAYYFLKMKED